MNLDTLIRYVFIALSALLPVFFLPFPWATSVQSKLLIVSLAVLAMAIAHIYERYTERTLIFPRSHITLAVILLPIAYGLSAIAAGALPSSFVGGTGEQDTVAIMVLFYALVLIGSLSWRSPEPASLAFLRASLAGSLALMAIQVFHVLVPGISLGILQAPASSVFGSWHEVGILAGLSIFLTVALWQTKVLSGYWRYVAIALSALSAVMLFVVNMRDVWILFALLMVTFALYNFYAHARAQFVPRLIVPVLIGILAALSAIAGPTIYESLPSRLQVLQIEVRPSWQGTFAISRETVAGPRTALLGTGPNTFSKQWSLYKPAAVNMTEFWNVDFTSGYGFIPTTFVTVGLLGILAWIAVLGSVLWAFWRFIRKAPGNSDAPILVPLFGAALYLCAFHIVYVPTFSLSALTFLMLGVIAAWAGHTTWPIEFSAKQWRDTLRTVIAGVVLIACILAAIWTLRALVSDLLVSRSAAVYIKEQRVDKALSLVQKALTIYGNNDRAHRAAVELGLIRLGELVSGGDTSAQTTASLQVSLEATIQHGLAAISINGGDYQNWLALAGLYRELAGAGVQGAYENARAAYEEVYAENPLNPLPLVQMAQLDVAQNKRADALALLEKAIGLKSDFAAAYFLRSQIHASEGTSGQAVLDARRVVEIAPEDALGWFNLGAVLYDAGSYGDAADSLERATALQSDYSNALYVLALAYDKLGRSEEAIAALQKVSQLNPSNEEVEQLIEDIHARDASGTKTE